MRRTFVARVKEIPPHKRLSLFFFALSLFWLAFITPMFSAIEAQPSVRDTTRAPAQVDSLKKDSFPLRKEVVSVQGLAFSYRPVTKEELASACENHDPVKNGKGVLRIRCEDFLIALNEGGADLRLVSDIPEYVRSLVVAPCPSGEASLGRILEYTNGRVVLDLKKWHRPFRKNEQCLYDNNRADWVLSLSCANTIHSQHAALASVAPKVTAPAPSPVVLPKDISQEKKLPPIPVPSPSGVSQAKAVEVPPSAPIPMMALGAAAQSTGKKKGRCGWVCKSSLIVGGGIIGAIAFDYVDKPCKNCRASAGPVNPPNGGRP